MKELVRCRPCGYVMEADKLGDVCPACGLPKKVFEPYREKVSANRLLILSLDIHPIAIHLSQTFVALVPLLIAFKWMFPDIEPEMTTGVIDFSLLMLPISLVLSSLSGVLDGLTRFKTLKTPLLRFKIIASVIILTLSTVMYFITPRGEYSISTFMLSLGCLACAVLLGLWGKSLLDVILPGTYPMKKGKKE
jgi:rubredoxin